MEVNLKEKKKKSVESFATKETISNFAAQFENIN
jgi:hypothetical protein